MLNNQITAHPASDSCSVQKDHNNIIRQLQKGFTSTLPPLDSPIDFVQKNNLGRFLIQKTKNGQTRLAVRLPNGQDHYAIHRNFELAYIRLVRTFYGHYAAAHIPC